LDFGFAVVKILLFLVIKYQLKMDEIALKRRFFLFALSIIRLIEKFPKAPPYYTLSNQLSRCGTSSAANYRAACRARSTPDFINKLGIVEEELDESLFFLEFTSAVDTVWKKDIQPIHLEGNELLAIIVASIKTARLRKQ
jgi:four helix bundle protein